MRLTDDERWDLIEKISNKVVTFGKFKHTLKDALGELTVKPLTGIPIAIAILYGFWSVFSSFAGTLCTDGFFVKLFDGHFLPWIQSIFPGKGGWFYYIFVGDPAADNCFEAFGVLTSGLFVAIGVVLPAIFIFYLMMALLEDVGYIILETKKQRFIMMTLLAIFIPCGAQLGIMQEVIPESIGIVLLYLIFGYFLFGFILNKLVPGKSPEILIDVPPYQKPIWNNIARKLRMRLGGFLKIAVPFVLFGCAIVNILYLTGTIDWLAKTLTPLLTGWFGVPGETVGPLIAAFLRKDLAVAQLSAINMSKYQMITSVVLVSIYFPCVATFAMLLKEGGKNLLGSLAVLVTVIFLYGGLINLIWTLLGVQ